MNITLCRARRCVGLSLMRKWMSHDFSGRRSKFFYRRLIRKIKLIMKFFCTILKYLTVPSIWDLICWNLMITGSEMTFSYVISTNPVDTLGAYKGTCLDLKIEGALHPWNMDWNERIKYFVKNACSEINIILTNVLEILVNLILFIKQRAM